MTIRRIPATLLQEIDPDRSPGLDIDRLTAGSNRKLHWRCSDHPDHRWQATVYSRVRGSRCPYCTNMRILTGFNDLATIDPDVAAQWHPTRNSGLQPTEVGAGASTRVWWQCTRHKNHVWQASVISRHRGSGCPYCAGKKKLPGTAPKKPTKRPTLAEIDPILAQQLHPTLNEPTSGSDPATISPSSSKKVFWICPDHDDHIWQASVNNRHRHHSGCPYCAGKKVLVGFNDLPTIAPDVAAQWHPTDNGGLTARDVTAGSSKIIHWLCPIHDYCWQASVKNRVNGPGCPVCAGKIVLAGSNNALTRYPDPAVHTAIEHDFADLVERLLPDHEVLRNQCGLLDNDQLELDLWIPDLSVAIEFNDVYRHSEAAGFDKKRHRDTLEACQSAGIRLLVVWSDDFTHRRKIVLRQIAHKLGATDRLSTILPDIDPIHTERVGARSLTVRQLTGRQAAAFLDTNHIQGRAAAGLHLGLVDDNDIPRAVLSVRRRDASGAYEIVRYATASTVPGGFERLLRAAERVLGDDVERWITFADLSSSDGSLYERTGFTIDRELEPDYSYRVGDRREHKFSYRVKRFRDDPGLEYRDGLSERELAELNGLSRVWDHGKIRYTKVI